MEKDLSSASKVVRFIQGFGDECRKTFVNGYCYWFAMILSIRFGGEIYYLPIENHFVTKIDDYYYDANGIAEFSETPYRWSVYMDFDPYETQRIIRDCVLKEEPCLNTD